MKLLVPLVWRYFCVFYLLTYSNRILTNSLQTTISNLSFEQFIQLYPDEYSDCIISINSTSCISRRSIYKSEIIRLSNVNNGNVLFTEGSLSYLYFLNK